ncbi:pantothenate kinase [Oscillatoriales cyanobacterium USR001]|nr:pantothenate kinase [Oscillatoriales cyanobacterium USR001]
MQLALMIGNSRLHWAKFSGVILEKIWDTEHLTPDAVNQLSSQFYFSSYPLPLVIASVVPEQTALWQNYPNLRIITLDELPLHGLYPTLGIDRALAVLGAGIKLGWPILVIDAGTALTFTGADVNQRLVGGAILPGLMLQLSSLGQKTAMLPLISLPEILPRRWAVDTVEAMQSGVIYSLIAGVRDFIADWRRVFPDSKIAITGGDRTFLLVYLQALYPDLATSIVEFPEAIFWGIIN